MIIFDSSSRGQRSTGEFSSNTSSVLIRDFPGFNSWIKPLWVVLRYWAYSEIHLLSSLPVVERRQTRHALV